MMIAASIMSIKTQQALKTHVCLQTRHVTFLKTRDIFKTDDILMTIGRVASYFEQPSAKMIITALLNDYK